MSLPTQPIADRRAAFWTDRAEHYLRLALGTLEESDECIMATTAATACLQIAWGDLPPDPDLNGYEPDRCTCPPDLAARGGWSSRCAEHGRGTRTSLNNRFMEDTDG